MGSRKEFEESLITQMLEEIRNEPMCNILQYAAAYLRGESLSATRSVDLAHAEILDKYAELMSARITEVRE